MKILVVLENHFYIDEKGLIWCDRIIDYNFLKRYLNVFEEVCVCGRAIKSNQTKGKLIVSGESVSFIPLPDFIGIKGLIKNLRKIKKVIRYNLKSVDCILYRAPTHLSLFTYKEALKQKKVLAIEFMMSADKMIEGNGVISKIANKIIDLKSKKMCMKANAVSYVTDQILQKRYPCKAIKYGETKEYFTTSYSTIDIGIDDFKKMDWCIDNKPNTFKIIHTGYMDTYRKGQQILLKASKIVKDRGYSINVELVGDGRKKSEFEELTKKLGINNIVTFTGQIQDKKEIFRHLRNSHIMVFPTQSEGLPRTLIEAMAVGLPCISTPVDGILELIQTRELVDYNDIEGYANKIIELINDWERMIKISNRNYDKALKYEKSNLDMSRNKFYEKIKRLCKLRKNWRSGNE